MRRHLTQLSAPPGSVCLARGASSQDFIANPEEHVPGRRAQGCHDLIVSPAHGDSAAGRPVSPIPKPFGLAKEGVAIPARCIECIRLRENIEIVAQPQGGDCGPSNNVQTDGITELQPRVDVDHLDI